MGFDFPVEVVREGRVRVLVPRLDAFVEAPWEYAPSKAPVFYNPAMELARDVAVLALQVYQRRVDAGLRVCEPLAGCGVRGVRFAVEVRGVDYVLLNDINPDAAAMCRRNVAMNHLEGRVDVESMDANALLSAYAAPGRRFDAIDVDPFGSPAPYLDSALRAVKSGGLLALTATDMAPLCGVHPRACLRKYGGLPLRTEYCHELAVRLLLGCVARVAAIHNLGVDVALSHATDHYVRVYCIVRRGKQNANRSMENLGYILHCFNCLNRKATRGIATHLEEKCEDCGGKYSISGPLWLGPIFNKDFCRETLEEVEKRDFRLKSRIRKLLSLIVMESGGPPTYHALGYLCDVLQIRIPPLRRVVEELRAMGYTATATHFNPRGVRTDAPARVVREVVRSLA